MNKDLFTCPCCGYKTIEERYNYESCSICKWVDDDLQEALPDITGGANEESLREAQKNFREIGKCSKSLLDRESKPVSNYEKDKDWQSLEQN